MILYISIVLSWCFFLQPDLRADTILEPQKQLKRQNIPLKDRFYFQKDSQEKHYKSQIVFFESKEKYRPKINSEDIIKFYDNHRIKNRALNCLKN